MIDRDDRKRTRGVEREPFVVFIVQPLRSDHRDDADLRFLIGRQSDDFAGECLRQTGLRGNSGKLFWCASFFEVRRQRLTVAPALPGFGANVGLDRQ